MASARPQTPSDEVDSPAAIERAVLHDDFSGVSPEMRERIIKHLRAMIQEGIDSGPAVAIDWNEFKRQARERLTARQKAG